MFQIYLIRVYIRLKFPTAYRKVNFMPIECSVINTLSEIPLECYRERLSKVRRSLKNFRQTNFSAKFQKCSFRDRH